MQEDMENFTFSECIGALSVSTQSSLVGKHMTSATFKTRVQTTDEFRLKP